MSLYPGNSNVILAGAGCEQITRSQDKGNTWTTVKSSSVACGEIPKIAFDLDDPNTIYGTVFGWPTPYSITKSTDGGLTWEYPERLTINDPFWSLTYNDEAKLIVAGTSTAVYASNDGGETWHTLGSKKPGFWMMKSSRRRILVTDGNTLFYGDIP